MTVRMAPADTIATAHSPTQAPFVSRRVLALFGAIAVLWTVLAWFLVERQLQERAATLIEQNTKEARQGVAAISTNVDRVYNRLQGLAAVLAAGSDAKTALASFPPGAGPSPLPYEARKAAWTQRPDLLALSRQLLAAAEDIGVDIIWVINAGGDCVAASNAAGPMSFVGTNYGDRSYFTSPQAGKRGRQYAVGRVTKVPGLFFSAPVTAEGRFLGAVAVKSDLPRIASAINHRHAFVTDDQGVIILAADHTLEMRALPGAAVHQMPAEQRMSRYLRHNFDTLDMGAAGGPGELRRIAGSPHPHVAAHSELPQHGVTVHILMPIKDIAVLRGDALVTFVLAAFSGILLTALVFGARAYLSRTRQHRKSMEARNESLSRLNERLDKLASVDPVTGLYNQRFLWDFLNREVLRARRSGKRVAVIMLDIDHFKRINDTWGHQAGDAVLKATADTICASVRGSDIVSRYGGEEMLVVLPEATLPVAIERAETIRRAMETMRIDHAGRPLGTITASLGVAVFPEDSGAPEALVRAADEAMYEAKKSGRNRVVVYAMKKAKLNAA